MKIEFEINDKYKDTNLYLMWGMVPIARRLWTKQYWEIKVQHCSQCGKCCSDLEDTRHPFVVAGGVCEHLNIDNICSLSGNRPFGCSVAEPNHIPECTVRWERR